MKRISISEFQKLSGLSDRALVCLLAGGQLPVALDGEGKLLIDSHGLDIETVIQSVSAQVRDKFAAHQALIEERISALMAEKLDDLVEEALTRIQNAD